VSLTVGCHKKGMAFGTGSAVAHRAVDAVAGPRQIEHGKKRKENHSSIALLSIFMGLVWLV
jgi:hypothetical protein